MDVKGQAAIVTGGHSGMGFGAAQALAAKGCKVTILGRRSEIVQRKATQIGALGLGCDVADPEQVDAALQKAESVHGTARILIHAAAIGDMVMLLSPDGSGAPLGPLRAIVETNVWGTLLIARAFSSRLTQTTPLPDGPRGVIVNVSSIGASDGAIGAVYSASKGAVDGLGLALARDLGAWRIRVVTIAPGGIDTEMMRAGATPALHEAMRTMVPALGRLGRPEEFGALALHVCENDYLNGCKIRLDGGFRIPYSYDLGGGARRPEAPE